MRKFIFSSAMIGIVAGGWNTLKQTKKRPNDWRIVLLWIGWGLSAAIAIGDVVQDARERQLDS
jgi:hypothetical protein